MVAAEQLRGNADQWLAYNSTGHCVILAGPGSGKTKTLTIKLARILAEDVCSPRGVACITFNIQCARELKKRLGALGVEDNKRVVIGTLHSFCLQNIVIPYAPLTPLPKKYPIKVASLSEVAIYQQKALDYTVANEKWGPRFDKYRRIHLERTAPEWRTDDEEAASAIEAYEKILDDQGLIDFDGIILIALHLVENYPWIRKALAARFPILVVDEYQDLGHALDQIVQCLCFDSGIRLIAVGDPDQSIYGFTGAEPSLLRTLSEQKEVQQIHLRMNYRCGAEIIKASEVALGELRGFQSSHNEAGTIFFHDRPAGIEDQTNFICENLVPAALKRRKGRSLGDVAILYLNKNDGNIIAKAVESTGMQYIRVDGNNPYQPSPVTYWLEDCAAWCAAAWETGTIRLSGLVRRWLTFNERLCGDKDKQTAKVNLVRFLYSHRDPNLPLHKWLALFMNEGLKECLEQEPKLEDDKEKVKNLLEVSSTNGPLGPFTVAYFGGQGGSPDHLCLSTLHSAKGLEYDVVIMFGLEEGRLPYYTDSGDILREKRRLFYVGLTRARHEVHFVYSGWYNNNYGRRFNNGRSRFISEVEKNLIK